MRRIFISSLFLFTLLDATATQECFFNAAYFNVTYINNYGGDDRTKNFALDVSRVANVVIRFDSIIKSNVHKGLIKNYIQFELIDNYASNYRIPKGSFIRNGKEIHIRLTDSIAVNKVLKEIWGIEDYMISPNTPAHIWLFSLHIGLFKNKKKAISFMYSLDIDYGRPDTNFFWFKVYGELYSPMGFYQYEKDGFYHCYTGLYLSKDNVMQAKELIEEEYHIKATITSHYITPMLLKKYVLYR